MYDNIHIGSNVDICRKNGQILSGKVKWKGSIIHRKGFWIGVELEDQGTYLCTKHDFIFLNNILQYYSTPLHFITGCTIECFFFHFHF